jgi:hypothetical protein
MLFQTGYLTIKEINMMGIKSKYILSYPNQEVKESFLKHFLASYTSEEAGTVGSKILAQIEAVGYHEKYLSSGKKIKLIGVGLDSKEKNISDYQEKEI